jgi:hypothetical protein
MLGANLGWERQMKCLTVIGIILALNSCSKFEVEPVGEPYRVTLQVSSATSGLAQLDGLVDYGPFGGVNATVDFSDGQTVIASTSARIAGTEADAKLWDYKFSSEAKLKSGQTYNLTATVHWNSPKDGVAKTLKSEPVKFLVP